MEPEKPDAKNEHDGNQSVSPEYTSPSVELWLRSTTDLSSFSMASSLLEIRSDTKPPVPATGQPGNNYDPNRIPESIFSSKHDAPGEWSSSSIDSLFSIQNSFSRNSSLLRSIPEEPGWISSQPHLSEAKSDELLDLVTVTIPPIVEVPPTKESSVMTRTKKKDLDISKKVVKEETETVAKQVPEEIARPSAAVKNAPDSRITSSRETPRQSNESITSSSSFAFPILVKDEGRTGSMNGVKEKPRILQEQSLPKETTPKPKATSKKNRLCCFTRWNRYYCC